MAVKFWQKKRFLPLVLFVVSFLIIFRAPIDPDLGWHWRMGQIIWETKTFPDTTPFSYNFTDYKIASFYWLAQVVLYFLIARVGIWSLPFVTSLVGVGITVTLFFLARRSLVNTTSKPDGVYVSAMLLLGLLISLSLRSLFIGGRPLMFGLVFLVTLVYLLDMIRQGKTWPFLALPFLFLAWVNTYGDFIYGLWVLAAFWSWQICLKLGRLRGLKALKDYLDRNFRSEVELGWGQLLLFGTSITVSAAATLINPYHTLMWQSILGDVDSFHLSHIAEWAPPNVKGAGGGMFLVVFCLALVFSVLHRKKMRFFDFVGLVGLGLLNIRFFYVFRFTLVWAAVPILIGLVDILYSLKGLLDLDLIKKRLPPIGVAFLAVLVLLFGLSLKQTLSPKELAGTAYPYGALAFLGKEGLPGRVFNTYHWGGYLIWHRPDWPLFIYGNMPAWKQGNESVFRDYMFINNHPEVHAVLLDQKYQVDWALIQENSALAKFLSKKEGWKELYRDEVAIVFQRQEL